MRFKKNSTAHSREKPEKHKRSTRSRDAPKNEAFLWPFLLGLVCALFAFTKTRKDMRAQEEIPH
jgi:hypothetical protein